MLSQQIHDTEISTLVQLVTEKGDSYFSYPINESILLIFISLQSNRMFFKCDL